MPGGDFQDKTEEATPKKLDDARKKGQVAKSQDLTASAILLMGMLTLLVTANFMFDQIVNLSAGIFTHLNEPYGDYEGVRYWFNQGLIFLTLVCGPILLTVFIMALLINVAQVNLVFSAHPLIPKWANLNIFNPSRYKKFFELSAIMRLVFGLAKLTVVSIVCYFMILGLLPEVSRLVYANPKELMYFLFFNAFLIGLIIAIILLCLGIVDFLYQKWKFARDQKMSKQDVKEERKQQEGDVQVKAKLRQMMQSFSQTRTKTDVPESDVVIANPVHYAIAVKYDPETMDAPLCMAKGARRLALMIKELAKENNVPIVENPVLARAMYNSVTVGALIPSNFYHSVAEVLAYVYRLNEKMSKKTEENPSTPNLR